MGRANPKYRTCDLVLFINKPLLNRHNNHNRPMLLIYCWTDAKDVWRPKTIDRRRVPSIFFRHVNLSEFLYIDYTILSNSTIMQNSLF